MSSFADVQTSGCFLTLYPPQWINKWFMGYCLWSDIWNVSCIELRILKSSKLWSSQLWTQFKQLRIEAWKSQDFDSRYRCDALTNWAMKQLALGAGHLWVLMSPWRMDEKWYMSDIMTPSSVASQFSWLERRTGIARSRVQTLRSPDFFRLLYAIA